MTFAPKANRPLVKAGGKTSTLPEQSRPQLRLVGLAVSPTTFTGMPAGGATTKVVRLEPEEGSK